MMLFHAPRRESRKQAGKLDTACIAIEGSGAACGEAVSFGSAAECCSASRLRNCRPQGRRPCRTPSAASGITLFAASPCFPGFGVRDGEAKNGPKGTSDFIEKIWSGRRDSNPRPQPWQGCDPDCEERCDCISNTSAVRCRFDTEASVGTLQRRDPSHVREQEPQKTPFQTPFEPAQLKR